MPGRLVFGGVAGVGDRGGGGGLVGVGAVGEGGGEVGVALAGDVVGLVGWMRDIFAARPVGGGLGVVGIVGLAFGPCPSTVAELDGVVLFVLVVSFLVGVPVSSFGATGG